MAVALERRISSLCISGSPYRLNTYLSLDSSTTEGTTEVAVTQREEIPKHPEYEKLETRLTSFHGWEMPTLQPSDLANAGFYYTGLKDYVLCFFCGGGIKDWEIDDNPWNEHNRWFPDCAYLNKCQDRALRRNQPDNSSHQSSIQITAQYPLSSATPGPSSVAIENQRLKEERMCKTCFDEEVCVVFLPCCHLVSCEPCSRALSNCPICRCSITDRKRVYMS